MTERTIGGKECWNWGEVIAYQSHDANTMKTLQIEYCLRPFLFCITVYVRILSTSWLVMLTLCVFAMLQLTTQIFYVHVFLICTRQNDLVFYTWKIFYVHTKYFSIFYLGLRHYRNWWLWKAVSFEETQRNLYQLINHNCCPQELSKGRFHE